MGRYFAGITIPPVITEKLARLSDVLKPVIPAKRWYAREQLHITTNFLGELDQAAAEKAMQMLSDIVPKHQSFKLALAATGAFPHAKVVWCGVAGETDKLRAVQHDLRHSLASLGVDRFERAQYVPHITLARTDRLEDIQAKLRSLEPKIIHLLEHAGWTVHSVCLFESVSAVGGPKYPVLHEVKLADNQ